MKGDRPKAYVKGYWMPISARGVGEDIGFLAGAIAYDKFGYGKLKYVAVAGCEVFLFDLWLHMTKIKESTNFRKIVTGIVGGFGLIVICFKMFSEIYKSISHLRKD